MSEPFEWRGGWYLWYKDQTGKRKRKLLGKTKKEAFTAWKAGLAAGTAVSLNDPLFATVAAKWLALQLKRLERGNVSIEWVERASWTIEKFRSIHPKIKCSQITHEIATGWLPKGTGAEHERTSAGCLKQILRWATGSLIASNPLETLKLERGGRREALLTISQHRRLVHADYLPRFRAMLWFAWWTGARPTELRLLKWEHVTEDCTRAVMTKHKNRRKTNKPRTIYFNHAAQRFLRKYRRESGHVFLNSRNKPWTKDAIVQRMADLRVRTGVVATAYTYRHSYITRALTQGKDIAVVAELTGTSVEMISRNYGHLDKQKDHLAAAASSII